MLGEYSASSSQFGIGVAGISSSGYGVAAEAFGQAPAFLAYAKGAGAGAEVFDSNAAIGISSLTTGNYSVNGTALVIDDEAIGNSLCGPYESCSPIITDSTGVGGSVGAYIRSASGYPMIVETGGTGEQTAGIFSGSIGTKITSQVQLATDDGYAAIFSSAGYRGAPVVRITNQAKTLHDDAFDVISDNGVGSAETFVISAPPSPASSDSPVTSDVQIQGDVLLTGSVYNGCTVFPATASSCQPAASASIRTRTGRKVDAFATRDANPTIEDEGEAQLVNGSARVALDPTFAATMSDARYLVFTTPRGDCHGLFVTNASSAGFEVRELSGGHATVAFDYRIVAKAADATSSRIAMHVDRKPLVITGSFRRTSRIPASVFHRIAERAKAEHAKAAALTAHR